MVTAWAGSFVAEFQPVETFRITRARPVPGLGTGMYSEPVDVTVTDGTITAIEPTRGVGDGDFDADGANLMPGLWDNHTHFSLASLIGQCARFSHKATQPEIIAAVEDHMRYGLPRLIGYGFRSATWPTPPTAADLDAVTSTPVALISRDLHSVWCNTPALEQAGAAGHPTGFLVEEEAFTAIHTLMARYLDLVEHAVQASELEAASRGIVGIVDFSFGWAVEAWQQRAASRPLGLRVEAATYPERLDDLVAMGVRTGDELAENLKVGPLKVIADGSMGSRTAHCITPYPNPLPEYPNGKLNYTRPELVTLLKRAREARLRVAAHAIGDAACHDVLNAFEAARVRGSVEHVQCVAPVDLPRFAKLKLVASIQPAHQLEDAGVVDRVWPDAKGRAYPMLDLLRAGAKLALGSDAPVAPLDPWKAIEAACHRPYRPDQAITPLAALQASTRTSLNPGQPADLVLTAGPGMAVLTMLGGRVTFKR
jgi:conserved protein, putative metal-dependent hydrolase